MNVASDKTILVFVFCLGPPSSVKLPVLFSETQKPETAPDSVKCSLLSFKNSWSGSALDQTSLSHLIELLLPSLTLQ